ncbi:MAG: protein kinase [Burkholderiales bacterium]|nr:protein kinase [Burkholderiales bacterium]
MSEPLPERIGKYPVIRALGRGATSRVFLANDPFNSQQVAIKLVQRDPQAGEELRRQVQSAFLNEAALAGKLQHPHIAAIHDAVNDGDQSYIVMEYVGGGTLERHCGFDALLPVDRVVELMFMACLALDYAARQGVIHCDIKPANLLLTAEEKLKISDFGTAQYAEAAHTYLTGVGSPLYMSPEQVQDKRLNHQTDIYSLGVVMYQLLAGKAPFQGSSHESLMYQIVTLDPPPPSQHRPELPPALERVVMRALAKDREARYAEWREFAADLEQLFGNLNLPDQDRSEAERFSLLRPLPLFRGFGDIEIWETLRIGRWLRLRAGATVIREGEPCEGFYIIAAGEALVSRDGQALDKLGPGHFFGDVLYFEASRAPRGTTVTATAQVELLEIRGAALRGASAACQVQFNQALLRMLVRRVERQPARASGP